MSGSTRSVLGFPATWDRTAKYYNSVTGAAISTGVPKSPDLDKVDPAYVTFYARHWLADDAVNVRLREGVNNPFAVPESDQSVLFADAITGNSAPAGPGINAAGGAFYGFYFDPSCFTAGCYIGSRPSRIT